jgi:aminopeptidase-like protein
MIDNILREISYESKQLVYDLAEKLFPINRSITGKGVRETFDIIGEVIPLDMKSIESGTQVFDWTIPQEWAVDEAYISDLDGNIILSFKDNNLHLMGYSSAVDQTISKDDLMQHLIYDKNRPDSILYSTSYYNKDWAFCIEYDKLKDLNDDFYKVVIKSKFFNGCLDYAESLIDNGSKQEILVSSYVCHPSMANDSLSGVVTAVYLYKIIKSNPEYFRSYNIRFVFAPETIGSIVYLCNNKNMVKDRTHSGLVLTCLGDKGGFNYKRTFFGDNLIDNIAEYILNHYSNDYQVRDYCPTGSDERQYGSPGFRMPVGVLTRSMFGEFPEYHTSKDNLSFIKPEYLAESLYLISLIFAVINMNKIYSRVNPFCEPQMSKYDLYPKKGGAGIMSHSKDTITRMKILNLCDGNLSLLDIAKKINVNIFKLQEYISILVDNNLLECKLND